MSNPIQIINLADNINAAIHKINQNFAALMNQNGSGQPVKIWTGSRAEYDALTPDSDTLYFITG